VDVVTTIDVGMQDLAERALVDELKEINGEMGVAILMEVKTGDVKAIVNMTRGLDGNYYEMVNNAISYRCEPGSVFKVASFLVALDDGVIDTTMTIPTGCGVMEMHGRPMKDHNWRRGGYGTINVARALEVSSNIGVSYLIDKYYGSNPRKYVEGLYRIGIHEDLKLPLVGYHTPMIRMPDTKTTDRAKYWSKTTLPWMSIGCETQIAPINTVAFYNAIANDGKMMQPRFIKQLVKNGEVIKEFEPVVLKERIAKPQTIKTMQTILEHVVSQGLGKKAGSKSFKVAGKTGTAQVADQFGSYHSGVTRYWLSFAGFFPADNPRYTCIVCLKKSGLPASGGGMSGVVFHHIAEGVMAQNLKRSVDAARDASSIMTPDVKRGDNSAANYVLASLKTKASSNSSTNYRESSKHTVPDVTGMGAKDAVYLLESRHVKARVKGRGKVKSQSIHAGTAIKQGMVCELTLD
jgi:cell division protein FtsI (penicillin-binding protein 3)